MEIGVNPRKALALAVAVALVLSGVCGWGDRLFGLCGMARVEESNVAYLDRAFENSVKGFLVLSAIKSGVAMIEGSDLELGWTAGPQVTVELQYGDMVQSIYDCIDIAWRTALAGGTVLLVVRLLVQTVAAFDQVLLACLLFMLGILVGMAALVPAPRALLTGLKKAVLFCYVPVMALYFVLPLAVSGAAWLSARISVPLVEEAAAGYRSVQHDLSSQALQNRLALEDDDAAGPGILDFREKYRQIQMRVKETSLWLKKQARAISVWTFKLVAGYLFDCIAFPLAFMLVVYILAKGFAAYILGLCRDKTMRQDIARAVAAWYGHRTEPVAGAAEPGREAGGQTAPDS